MILANDICRPFYFRHPYYFIISLKEQTRRHHSQLLKFHKESGKLATVTAVQPPGRFGALILDSDAVKGFREKPEDGGWINGGFFVLNPQVIDYIENDDTIWEREPMEKLVQANQINAFLHDGFFQPMDTLREKNYLESLWEKGKAPWKVW